MHLDLLKNKWQTDLKLTNNRQHLDLIQTQFAMDVEEIQRCFGENVQRFSPFGHPSLVPFQRSFWKGTDAISIDLVSINQAPNLEQGKIQCYLSIP